MAAVGYISSEIVVLQTLEEGVRVGWFQGYNALHGFLFGGRFLLNFTASYAVQIFDSVVLGFHLGLSVLAGLIGHFTARDWR